MRKGIGAMGVQSPRGQYEETGLVTRGP
jgi:hypothetical protein